MKKIERRPSILLLKLLALKRRLSPEHPKYEEICNDVEKRKAGYYGEQSLDYYLSIIPKTDFDYQILHDLRLPFKENFFQIDTLLLFPSFFIILEVKNYTGTLLFDPDHQQLIQIRKKENGESEKSIQEPILQVKRQFTQFHDWLKLNKFSSIPGECLVVLTNSNAIVKTVSNPQLVKDFVVRSAGLPLKMEKLLTKYTTPAWSRRELKKAAALIHKCNIPLNNNLLEYYGIQKSELLTGVYCPKCDKLAMRRLKGRWKCPYCLYISINAHIPTLEDFSLLIGQSITTKEFCEFMHINSFKVARKLLIEMDLEQEGRTKMRKFILK